MQALDWAGLLRAGLTEGRLRPAEFWALTPAELIILLGRDQAQPALTREALDRLTQRYPDAPASQEVP